MGQKVVRNPDDEWPPKRARSLPDWAEYWKRQRWDRRLRREIRIQLAPVRRVLQAMRPRRIRGVILWRWQRLRRGWGFRDLWGMDTFISQLCGEMAASLLEVAHGYPCMGHTEGQREPACVDPETYKPRECSCKAEYDEALRKISEGLLAYAAEPQHGLPVQEWMKKEDERIKAGQESFRLLADWLPTLWD